MSNQEYCPLCTEEMDLTDQQFKPCTCGYQICVWCWNHLVEESETDEVLCPACQSPYDKEKIKGMAISSDRLEEISSMEKQKIDKTKSRTSELSYDPDKSRVVQRNLVYITGIPVNLANEETLRKREFFGQYGKIMKIFIKPSGPSSPHYTKTSAVYVTFSKEEEAIKCIQLINGFILNGSLLKACYGTSRYCHSWLLKKPCKNQDCSYLHHPAPQGDICTKDDVASTCTSKIQHCVRTASLVQQSSGSSLPPPADSYYSRTDKALVSSVTPSSFGSGGNLRSCENEKSNVPSTATCGLTVGSDRASRTTAVCEGLFNTSSVTNRSITSPAVVEVHVLEQAQDEYQRKQRILVPGNQSLGLGRPGNHESSHQDCQSSYAMEHIVATAEVSPENNIVVTNTASKPYCLWGNHDTVERIMPDPDCLDSRRFKQKAPNSHDLTRKTSSSFLRSAINSVSFASSAQLSSIPVRECSFTSLQDSPISNLQDMTLSSPDPQKVPHVNLPSGYFDLELTELACKSEAKGTSVYPKGIGIHDTSSVIIGQKVGEFPPFLNNAIGTSFQGEPKKLHTKNPGCRRQDFELKDMEHSSDHNSVENMVKNVDAWCKNNVELKKDIISDKTCLDSKEYIVKSDMSTLKPGLGGRLATCQSLADRVDGGTYRGGDCSNVFNSRLPSSSSASTVSLAILGGAKHTSGQSLRGSMNVLVPDKEYYGVHIVEKKTVRREESTNKPTVGDLKNCMVQTNELTIEAVNEPKHLLRLHQPASSITKSVISPPPRNPPGFPPKHVSHEGQKCSTPLSSGNAQSKFPGKQSIVNSSQKIPRSDAYFNMEPIDDIKMSSRGGMLQSATHPTSPVYSSSLIGLDGSDRRRVESQLSVGSRHQNPVEVDQSKICLPHMAFHGANTYHGSQEACIFGSPAAMDSRVIGRRGQTGLSNSTNNGTSSIVHHQFLQPVPGQNDPEFLANDFSRLHYSQPR